MNLIEKYAAEVGKYLPARNRADIEAEIRSTLEDMLEERMQAPGAEREALTLQLLKEYGAPRKVAESYGATQYLVGPRLFPIFELVLKIVAAVLLGVGLLGFGLNVVRMDMAGPALVEALGKMILDSFGGVLMAFGNIVLVFAILERVLPASEQEAANDEWEPSELAKEPHPDLVKAPDQVAEIVFTVIFLALFNLYPQYVGIVLFSDGQWSFIPVLTEAFFRYMPWINLLWVLQVGLDVWLIRKGRWDVATRLVNLALKLGSIALAYAMLIGPAIIKVSTESLAGTSLADLAGKLDPLSQFILVPFLIVMIIVPLVEIIQTAYHLFRSRGMTPYPTK
jgi:hypothetical protein